MSVCVCKTNIFLYLIAFLLITKSNCFLKNKNNNQAQLRYWDRIY